MMSSDLRLAPVVCFSLTAPACLDDSPDNALRGLLTLQARRNREYLAEDPASPHQYAWQTPPSLSRSLSLHIDAAPADDTIGPLLSTSWDQSRHYNLYCPLDPQAGTGYDGHVPAGCVATAYGQVMKYHAWPAWGRGSISYYDDGPIHGTHDVDVSDPFNWSDMQSSYSPWNEEPAEAVEAIAELLYELGVAAHR